MVLSLISETVNKCMALQGKLHEKRFGQLIGEAFISVCRTKLQMDERHCKYSTDTNESSLFNIIEFLAQHDKPFDMFTEKLRLEVEKQNT